MSLNNLGLLLKTQGDFAGARPLFERALAIREKALGSEHPSTATSLNNLASLLKDQGDLAGARLLYERALAIREKALGSEHPSTANEPQQPRLPA
jgi:tetratricopeptide (TPR) repeat protein